MNSSSSAKARLISGSGPTEHWEKFQSDIRKSYIGMSYQGKLFKPTCKRNRKMRWALICLGALSFPFLPERGAMNQETLLWHLQPFDLPQTHRPETYFTCTLKSTMKALIVFKERKCHCFISWCLVFLACHLNYYIAKGKKSLLFIQMELK